MDTTLYDTDFYGWTQRQAAALKAGDLSAVDVGNLVEEIETLGRSEESALESHYDVLCTHLLKALHQPDKTSIGWKQSVAESRLQVAKVIRRNPGLKSKRDQLFADAYGDARRHAEMQTGLPLSVFPETPPFDRVKAESEDYLPERLSWTREQLGASARAQKDKVPSR